MQTPKLQFESDTASFFSGHIFGRRQPTLLVRLRPRIHLPFEAAVAPIPSSLKALAVVWSSVTGSEINASVLASGPDNWPSFAVQLALMTTELLRAAHLCVVDPPQVLSAPALARSMQWTRVLLPVAPRCEQATHLAWLAVLKVTQHLWLSESLESALSDFQAAFNGLKRFAPTSSNSPRFLAAAYENNIPVFSLGLEVFQYGQGRAAQWFHSTFTLSTPNIGVRLARDKQATSARLLQVGLPVPKQLAVASADLAVIAAQKMGYPVVIKPADLDGGQGVSAGLEREDQVRQAFERAQRLSKRVLIEKHVTGKDYRLTVLDSKLLWAIERQPAGVTGDGIRSVQALVDLENSHPARGEGPHAVLKRLQIDDEAQDLLLKQGLSISDVPNANYFVVLRRTANIATGGRPVAVNDKVHPDNAQLAVLAAEALRLDLAGVDLLIEDISRSWLETGAAICEVNAQPQLGATTGPHLYGQILKQRLGPDTRIPVVIVLGAVPQSRLARAIADQLTMVGFNTGCIDVEGTFLGQERLLNARAGAYAGGRLLLTHPKVDALVYSLDDYQALTTGLPFDRYDWLVVGSNIFPGFGQLTHAPLSTEPPQRMSELLSCILPACTERVVQLCKSSDLPKNWKPQDLQCDITGWEGLFDLLRLRWHR
jgi:cyanophycin synthetase